MINRQIIENVTLRTLTRFDASELFTVVDSNRAYLRRWLPWLDSNETEADTVRFIKTTIEQDSNGLGFVCAVRLQNSIVGVAGYHPINISDGSVVIGYWLAEQATGRGIMTECCRFLVDHAFSELGLSCVYIPVAAHNLASRAIPERLGFTQTGVIRDAEWLYDHHVDHVRYAMTKEDWMGEHTPPGDGVPLRGPRP